jgi:hypothetical protein
MRLTSRVERKRGRTREGAREIKKEARKFKVTTSLSCPFV